MSYTAFEKMRTVNYERYGKDLGPVQPPLLNNLLFLPGQSRESHKQKNAEEAAIEIEVWRKLYGKRI